MQPVLLDEKGKEIDGAGSGVLAIKASWPSQIRSVYGDHQRMIDTYFKPYPGYYFSQELGINDPQLELAMKLEEIARHDPYFVERNLYPNVDFYSGIILKAIGIPTSMFTVIFALARTVGWISHWQEMLSGPYKIGRPRQLYTGHPVLYQLSYAHHIVNRAGRSGFNRSGRTSRA